MKASDLIKEIKEILEMGLSDIETVGEIDAAIQNYFANKED